MILFGQQELIARQRVLHASYHDIQIEIDSLALVVSHQLNPHGVAFHVLLSLENRGLLSARLE